MRAARVEIFCARISLRWPRAGILLLASLLCISQASGKQPEFLINTWTAEEGLKNSSVTAIAQTPDGYLWVGTYNGLARFDGDQFLTFDPASTPELKNPRVRRLHADKTGTLWICLHDGSITSFRDGRFNLEWEGPGGSDVAAQAISGDTAPPTFLLNNGGILRHTSAVTNGSHWRVLSPPGAGTGQVAVEDKDGQIWTHSRDQRLWRFDSREFVAVPTNEIPGQDIQVLTTDLAGRVWVGTESTLALWTGTRFQNRTPTNGEPTLSVQHVLFTRAGEMWVLGNNRLRRAVDLAWVADSVEARGLFGNWETRLGMHEDWRGRVWLYHYGRGLFHIEGDGTTKHFDARDGFPGRRVDSFFEDREGNIWAGVDRGGLIRLREKRFTVLAPGEPTEARAAVTVSEDAAGGIWVGTYGAGLHRLANGSWENFFEPGGAQRGFVFSTVAGGDGRIWASAGEGEDLFVKTDREFTQYNPLVHGVKCILSARDGKIWVGTKAGLGVVDGTGFRLFWGSNGVPRLDIRCLAEDAAGVIWAGGGDGILYRVRATQGEPLSPPGPRTAQPIWSVLADTNGVVWAGTFRGGLLRFAAGKFTRITTQHGLPDDVICQLLDDENGNLWMGSQRGIFRVAKSELEALAAGRQESVTSVVYGRHDGLPSLECSEKYQPAAWRTHDGQLLFSTLKGVVMVEPDGVAPRRLPPPVVIERIIVDGVAYAKLASGVGGDGSALEIPADSRQVQFQYTGVSLVSAESFRFRYRLEGFHDDWIEAVARRSAEFNSLRAGSYTFRVQACSSGGAWSAPVSVTIRVRPHIYETWWFISLATAAAVALVAAIVRSVALRRIRRELEQLERQRAIERDRTRIAKDIHDDLGAGLTHIALLSEMAKPSAAEDTQTQLSQITEVARELTTSMDEIVWAIDPQNDSLDALITYVSKFTQDYLGAAQIRCRLDVPPQLPEHQLQAEVRHNLFLAVKEALNNVVKHARATEVWLRVQAQSESFSVAVEDNGRGLAVAAADESGKAGRVSSGRGLKNLEKRLAASGGRCVVESEAGRGTRVQFTVPLGAHSPELASSRLSNV